MTRVDGEHFSHRGRGLLLIGCVWMIVGVAVLTHTSPDTAWLLDLLPFRVRAALWIVTGGAAFFAAVLGAGGRATQWVFSALLVPACLRVFTYGWAWIAHLIGWGHGLSTGWVDSLAWALVVCFVLHEASTPVIPARVLHPADPDGGRGSL